MRPVVKLGSFAATLALVGGGAALAGAAVDPTDEPVAAEHREGGAKGDRGHGADSSHAGSTTETGGHPGEGDTEHGPAGLAVADADYRLRLRSDTFEPGRQRRLRFSVTDREGRVVRDDFQIEHAKRMHLILVRRDTTQFQHVHPRQLADGTWAADVRLRRPGVYRAFADFRAGGSKRTLAADVFVGGRFVPRALPEPVRSVAAREPAGGVSDLDVALATKGTLRAGRAERLSFAITRGGAPVRRIQPYLAARGHLVALREGDLGYLHVHPLETGRDHGHGGGSHANEVGFEATFPTAGRYRLFGQFKIDGTIRTASFTVEVAR